MTAINAMKFNESSGGMVADSQSSNELRKYDISDKVGSCASSDGNLILMGGSGVSSILYEAKKVVFDKFNEKEFNTPQFVCELSDLLTAVSRDIIEKEMKERFGISSREYIAGKLNDGTPIGSHLLSPIGEVYTGSDRNIRQMLNNAFLVLGADRNGTSLYYIPMGNRPMLLPIPYGTAGSGSDESDKVLCSFTRDLPREKKQDIPFVEGMFALITATNRSSEINQGVGGILTIAYFDDGKIVTLGENESLLATEIVKCTDHNLLSRRDALKSLEALLSQEKDCLKIEEKLLFKHPKHHEIMRFLRGYK